MQVMLRSSACFWREAPTRMCQISAVKCGFVEGIGFRSYRNRPLVVGGSCEQGCFRQLRRHSFSYITTASREGFVEIVGLLLEAGPVPTRKWWTTSIVQLRQQHLLKATWRPFACSWTPVPTQKHRCGRLRRLHSFVQGTFQGYFRQVMRRLSDCCWRPAPIKVWQTRPGGQN